ncbi:hypothetical protein HN832_00690 [archaeon]|jgi:hypothetical protein|nr:hypothetical protein [archaeon]MBT4373861.1 hypothetical protein [archaeon]MBT4532383.1 hypothetical protein [archaeon]MBT7001764.1 hypothetical protein [archaeon]MBT7281911.1 hypothetical protein [archaeon]
MKYSTQVDHKERLRKFAGPLRMVNLFKRYNPGVDLGISVEEGAEGLIDPESVLVYEAGNFNFVTPVFDPLDLRDDLHIIFTNYWRLSEFFGRDGLYFIRDPKVDGFGEMVFDAFKKIEVERGEILLPQKREVSLGTITAFKGGNFYLSPDEFSIDLPSFQMMMQVREDSNFSGNTHLNNLNKSLYGSQSLRSYPGPAKDNVLRDSLIEILSPDYEFGNVLHIEISQGLIRFVKPTIGELDSGLAKRLLSE